MHLAIGKLLLLRELKAPAVVGLGGTRLRPVRQLAEQQTRDGIPGHRFRRPVLAQRLAVGAVRLRRLGLGKLILGERVGRTGDGDEQENDAPRYQEEPGAARSRGRLVRTGRRVGGCLAHVDWVE